MRARPLADSERTPRIWVAGFRTSGFCPPDGFAGLTLALTGVWFTLIAADASTGNATVTPGFMFAGSAALTSGFMAFPCQVEDAELSEANSMVSVLPLRTDL